MANLNEAGINRQRCSMAADGAESSGPAAYGKEGTGVTAHKGVRGKPERRRLARALLWY